MTRFSTRDNDYLQIESRLIDMILDQSSQGIASSYRPASDPHSSSPFSPPGPLNRSATEPQQNNQNTTVYITLPGGYPAPFYANSPPSDPQSPGSSGHSSSALRHGFQDLYAAQQGAQGMPQGMMSGASTGFNEVPATMGPYEPGASEEENDGEKTDKYKNKVRKVEDAIKTFKKKVDEPKKDRSLVTSARTKKTVRCFRLSHLGRH